MATKTRSRFRDAQRSLFTPSCLFAMRFAIILSLLAAVSLAAAQDIDCSVYGEYETYTGPCEDTSE